MLPPIFRDLALSYVLPPDHIRNDGDSLYEQGCEEVKKKHYETALAFFKEAAHLGHAAAGFKAGVIIAMRNEENEDPECPFESPDDLFKPAIENWRIFAERGNAYALYMLGICHASGYGVTSSLETAYEHLIEANEKKCGEAISACEYLLESFRPSSPTPERVDEELFR